MDHEAANSFRIHGRGGARAVRWLLFSLNVANSSQAGPSLAPHAPTVIEAQAAGGPAWDGRHDVSAFLQAAVDAGSISGAVVHLPAGKWQLAKPVIMRGQVILEGDARGTILAPAANNSSDPLLLEFPVNTANVVIQDITFDGGGIDFTSQNPVLKATAGTNLVFAAVTVQNSRGIGLLLQGGMKSSGVRNSRFLNLGNHWKTTLNKVDRIQGLVFCCGQGNVDNFATGNYFKDIGLDALQIGDQSHFCAASNVFDLANNQINLVPAPDYPAGIFILHSAEAQVFGNLIHSAAGNGIDAPGLQNSYLSNNVVSGCGGCGIGLFLGYDGTRQTRGVLVFGNTISNNVHWSLSSFVGGITIAGGAPSDIEISANTVTDTQARKTQAYGIQVRENTKVSGLKIDRRNRLGGNRLGEMIGADYEPERKR
jgi:hypothetical protein